MRSRNCGRNTSPISADAAWATKYVALGAGKTFSIANDEQGYPLAQEGLRDFDMARHSDTGVTGERIAEYGSRLFAITSRQRPADDQGLAGGKAGDQKKADYLRHEIRYGAFNPSIGLPEGINLEERTVSGSQPEYELLTRLPPFKKEREMTNGSR